MILRDCLDVTNTAALHNHKNSATQQQNNTAQMQSQTNCIHYLTHCDYHYNYAASTTNSAVSYMITAKVEC